MRTLGAVIAIFVLGVLLFMFIGWLAMLALGAAHSHDPRIPALGWEASLWIILILRIIMFDLDRVAK